MKERIKLYWLLFRISFSVSAFTFGGGYVVIPILRTHFVERLNLLEEVELLDMAAIAQSSPGAIAVNLAALIGFKLAGVPGIIICAAGTTLPPIIILAAISSAYRAFSANRLIQAVLKGMEAGVAALIVDLIIDLFRVVQQRKNLFLTLLVPAAFIGSFVFRINVALIILGSALLSFFAGKWSGLWQS